MPFGSVAVVVVNHDIWLPLVNCIASGWVATPMVQEVLNDPAFSRPILAVWVILFTRRHIYLVWLVYYNSTPLKKSKFATPTKYIYCDEVKARVGSCAWWFNFLCRKEVSDQNLEAKTYWCTGLPGVNGPPLLVALKLSRRENLWHSNLHNLSESLPGHAADASHVVEQFAFVSSSKHPLTSRSLASVGLQPKSSFKHLR